MMDEIFRIKKKGGSLTWRFLRVIFIDGIVEGFKTATPYSDMTNSPFKMPTKSPRDSKWQLCMVKCSVYRQNS